MTYWTKTKMKLLSYDLSQAINSQIFLIIHKYTNLDLFAEDQYWSTNTETNSEYLQDERGNKSNSTELQALKCGTSADQKEIILKRILLQVEKNYNSCCYTYRCLWTSNIILGICQNTNPLLHLLKCFTSSKTQIKSYLFCNTFCNPPSRDKIILLQDFAILSPP